MGRAKDIVTIVRDALGLLIILSVAFSIFAIQVALNELSPDVRSVLTFADHLSMSVDTFFGVFVRLVVIGFVFLLGAFFFRALFTGGGVLYRAAARIRLPRLGARSATHFRAPDDRSNEHFTDTTGALAKVEFKTALTRRLLGWLFGVGGIAYSFWGLNRLIEQSARFNVSDVYMSPAQISQPILIEGAFAFFGIYIARAALLSRVDHYVNGVMVSAWDEIEKKFPPDVAARIDAAGEAFYSEKRYQFNLYLVLAFATFLIPLVAYFHGLSLANAHYYRLLSHNAADAGQAEADPARFAVEGSSVFRIVEQGILFFDHSKDAIVFRNDENSVVVRNKLKSGGVEGIGKRLACPLGVADKLVQYLFVNAYVLDDILGRKLGPCPTLAAFDKSRRSQDAKASK